MTLAGKVALVTGAGRGIGRSIAMALAGEGASIAVSARTQSQIDEVASAIRSSGGKAAAVRTDMRDAGQVARLAETTLKEFGRIDILVNNAGLGHFARVEQLSAADFDEMWEVNVRGVFLLTKAVLPMMSAQRSGDIVNIASLAGRNSFAGGAGYSATKWALIGFGRSLMLEVRENNIRVITLCPGSVDTGFAGPGQAPARPGVIPTAGDIAAVALDALRMPRNVMVSEIDIRPTNPKG
ncbi:MAG TPA: SDR family NAD(P)-dependent oxidoreductase [Bacteroidota bacterium]|nr:SDR family NAD(P)-dependent oxidoreductase [Bacteroidota bacterium]